MVSLHNILHYDYTVHSLYNALFEVYRNDLVISELCYNGTILHRNYRKMTVSFSYNSFVKLYGKTFRSHMSVLYHNPCYNEVHYKGTALYRYQPNTVKLV